jgi:Phosphopantetheine attachment site
MSHATSDGSFLARLLEAVRETLGSDPQDGSASFLDLGGDSLSAIIITEILREEDLNLDVEDLLSSHPLNHVARLIEA